MGKTTISGISRLLAVILLVFMLSGAAEAAMIKGTIYDFYLNKKPDVVVEINTVPQQTWVSKDGEYAFTLEPGNYVLKAMQKDGTEVIASAQENVKIASNGEYIVDLIMLPAVNGFTDELDMDIADPYSDEAQYDIGMIAKIAAVIVVLIIAAAFVYFYVSNRKRKNIGKTAKAGAGKKPAKDKKEKSKKEKAEVKIESAKAEGNDIGDTSQIIKILEKNDGRATQKDIRKDIPLSEAKISLMIAELESKGKVRKIKKGRGNIIILNK